MRTILIVDDSLANIELTKIAIKAVRQELTVGYATDGRSALQMLRNGHELPALILLDLKMPGMDAIDVLRELRADERFRDIPVVVVTSSSLESDRHEAIAAGADDYVEKLFDLDQFSKDLMSVIDRCLPDH